jgi:quinol monooxygenase YgiN
MTRLEVSARMTIRPGKAGEFKRQAAEIIRQAKARDTKTIRYDWFLNSNETACEVRETYENSDGLIEHRLHIGEALHKLFRECADDHAVTIYGDPSPQLVAIARGLKDVDIKWHSFFGGFETPPTCEAEVGAAKAPAGVRRAR